ncbi:unnamed protein product, partial [Iphiclides podalirius]
MSFLLLLVTYNYDFCEEPMFTTSRFGKPVIQYGRYRFNKRSDSKGPRMGWTCTKVSTGCRATIVTVNDEIIKLNNTHNH